MILSSDQQRRLTRATERALAWHAGQQRKGSEIPYVSHLLQVSGSVLEHGGDVDQAIAGLLHDALEDADSTEERLERQGAIECDFGAAVLQIVLDCTDTAQGEAIGSKAPWKERKTRYLAHLATTDPRSLLVAACDKCHNLRALVWDVRTHGLGYLDRFNSGPPEQIWYFTELIEAMADRIPRRLHAELAALLEDFRALLQQP